MKASAPGSALVALCLLTAAGCGDNVDSVVFHDEHGTWQYLKSPRSGAIWFGGEVGISDGILAAVDYEPSEDHLSNGGAVHVFTRDNAGTWRYAQTLTQGDGGPSKSYFASQVAVEGDVIAASSGGSAQDAAVFVFERHGDGEGELWELASVVPAMGLITSLDISDGAIFAGIPQTTFDDIPDTTGPGLVEVFVRDGAGGWRAGQTLRASDGGNGAAFGFRLAVDGDSLLVAAVQADLDGRVYSFLRTGDDWVEEESGAVLAPGRVRNGNWGSDLAVHDGLAVVGQYPENAGLDVLRFGTAGWELVDPLDEDASGRFVSSASAVLGQRVLATWSRGYHDVWLFDRQGDEIDTEPEELRPFNRTEHDDDFAFGVSLAVEGDLVVIGASTETGTPGHPFARSRQSGAVYVLNRSWRE